MNRHRKATSGSLAVTLALYAGVGPAAGIAVGAAIVLMNAGGRDLILATGEPFVPMLVLFVSLASIFAMLEISLAIFWPGQTD